MEYIESLPQEDQWDAYRSYGSEDGKPKYFPLTTTFMSIGLDPFRDFGQSDFEDLLSVVGIDESLYEDIWDLVKKDGDNSLDPEEVENLWEQIRATMEDDLYLDADNIEEVLLA